MSRIHVDRIELRVKNVDPRTARLAAGNLRDALAPALAARAAGGPAPPEVLPAHPGVDALTQSLSARVAAAIHRQIAPPPAPARKEKF